MKRPFGPSRYPASFTLWLGFIAFVPPLALPAALLATLNAVVSLLLCSHRPEIYTGMKRITAGLLLSLAAVLLFFGESALFLRWKENQAYTQRVEITRLRMTTIEDNLEKYRSKLGSYPDVSGIMLLNKELESTIGTGCPVLDGFGKPFTFTSTAKSFRISSLPPSPPGKATPPAKIILERRLPETFQNHGKRS